MTRPPAPAAPSAEEMIMWCEAKAVALEAEAGVWLHAGFMGGYDALSKEAELVRAIAAQLKQDDKR